MINYLIKTLLLFLVFLFNINFIFAEVLYKGPDDKKAIEESERAVGRLGDKRGAIPIFRNSVDILGLKSTSITGSSVGLSKELIDLGAKKVGNEIHVTLSGDVLFDFDKWEIKKEAEKTLLKLAQAIKELNKKNVIIEGHTDSKGSESYNLELSQKRADAVKDWFISRGNITGVVFQTKGYGESKPIGSNTNPDGSDNPEGRAKNRRVEIKILN